MIFQDSIQILPEQIFDIRPRSSVTRPSKLGCCEESTGSPDMRFIYFSVIFWSCAVWWIGCFQLL